VATETHAAAHFGWTDEPIGIAALVVFVFAYLLVVLEERTQLRKSKPVMAGAAIIWGLIALEAQMTPGMAEGAARAAFDHIFLEFTQLFFFLVVAMTYVAAMSERNVFEALRAELVSRGLTYRQLFWITGVVSFFLSAVLDNLTTALVMSGVILAVGVGNPRFVAIACVNLVVAANAGGAWSAFGDITTLMAWQAHKAEFFEFFKLFVPSVVNWVVPAVAMSLAMPAGRPEVRRDDADVKYGGWTICVLFALTIAITITAKQWLAMPAVYGMLSGLALLKVFAWRIAHVETRMFAAMSLEARPPGDVNDRYSIFRILAHAEWDTLLFFYGVLVCVGGLATIGYLEFASTAIYGGWGHTIANITMGVLSAIVDNIPIMYAVLQMDPPMDHGQWLLITLTTGVGGSLLSVGSAAGVALMGVSRRQYTFSSHLRWTWAIALGYALSVVVHLWINQGAFTNGIWR
jgi:Na+/H+ antiporter NhaD/arsenite permease-like protein